MSVLKFFLWIAFLSSVLFGDNDKPTNILLMFGSAGILATIYLKEGE
jgi:hypothetical protein